MHITRDQKTHPAGLQAARNFAWCSPVMAPGVLLVSASTCTKKIRPVGATGGPSRGGIF